MVDDPQRSRQLAFLKQTTEDLAKKAKLRRTPQLSISKNERLASVNVFQNRICMGEYFMSLWSEGKFNDEDVVATIAHEIAHLMDLRRDSHSPSFRNLLGESLWLSFGMLPIVIYVLSPNDFALVLSVLLAAGWGFSVPLIVRRVEVGIELEADRKAAMHLVKPQQLADALVKISSFGMPPKTLGLSAKLAFLASTITHPTFKERVQYLQSL